MSQHQHNDPSLSDAQTLVLREAEAARVASAGKPYLFGGATPEGFDCSGYVIFVFNAAYGAKSLPRVTAEQLRTQGRFPAIEAPPAPADLVFFSKSPGGSEASHVGIVFSDTRWIGSQSSTGVAYVSFENPFWKPRILSYGRYLPAHANAAIIPMKAGSFASTINRVA